MFVSHNYHKGWSNKIVVQSISPLRAGLIVEFTTPNGENHAYAIVDIACFGYCPEGVGFEVYLDRPLQFAVKRNEKFRLASSGPVKAPHSMLTHYSYLSGPEEMREPTGIFDLSGTGEIYRRKLVHRLLTNGELLAKLPFHGIRDMVQLRRAILAEEKLKKARKALEDPRR